jgi:hypothetical protein
MLFYGLLSVITKQSQNYEGNKPSQKLVEKFCIRFMNIAILIQLNDEIPEITQ